MGFTISKKKDDNKHKIKLKRVMITIAGRQQYSKNTCGYIQHGIALWERNNNNGDDDDDASAAYLLCNFRA
jgi:hypothetical protein